METWNASLVRVIYYTYIRPRFVLCGINKLKIANKSLRVVIAQTTPNQFGLGRLVYVILCCNYCNKIIQAFLADTATCSMLLLLYHVYGILQANIIYNTRFIHTNIISCICNIRVCIQQCYSDKCRCTVHHSYLQCHSFAHNTNPRLSVCSNGYCMYCCVFVCVCSSKRTIYLLNGVL